MKNSSSRIRGFSLLELLVVILIIGIVAKFIVPAASTIMRGTALNQAAQLVFDQFNLARQYALSSNHPVEVRLICFADPESPGEVLSGQSATPASGKFRAIQILETLDTIDPTTGDFVRIPLDKPQLLPQSIVIDSSSPFAVGAASLSSILSDARQYQSASSPAYTPAFITQPTSKDPPLPRKVNLNYWYVAFRFMPDGSTNLPGRSLSDPSGAWFITIHGLTDKMAGSVPPANFYTLQVDPISGTLKQFRPGI